MSGEALRLAQGLSRASPNTVSKEGIRLVSCGLDAFALHYPKKARLYVSDQEQFDPHRLTGESNEVGDEETKQIADTEEVEQAGDINEGGAREQAVATQAAPVAKAATPGTTAPSAKTVAWKEDPNDFDESTVEVAITFHPLKGRPQEERLLTFCIHNHSGSPVMAYYHQGELTDQSPLDRLQWAIAQEVKKFRAALSRQMQEQWEREEQVKQTRREQLARAAASRPTANPADNSSTQQQGRSASPPVTVAPALAGVASATLPHPTKQRSDLVQQNLF